MLARELLKFVKCRTNLLNFVIQGALRVGTNALPLSVAERYCTCTRRYSYRIVRVPYSQQRITSTRTTVRGHISKPGSDGAPN